MLSQSLFPCSFLLILGCSQPVSYPQNTFSFLPSVAEQNFKGEDSRIDVNTLKFAYSPTGDVLPLLYGMTKQIQRVDQPENAQLEFSIQEDKSQSPESYRLEITNEKIIIQAQSQAGLFYGFITLNQLLEDAIAQDTPLPLLEINDAPKIAFRPIQIDVKHHLEKKSYYYDLLDELAQLKINGIILEIEDKLQYKRRPEVGSADALSIDEWRAMVDAPLQKY